MLNRNSSQQEHLTASSVLTSHPAATNAACATVAKGICTVVTLDKAAKKVLNSSESNTVNTTIDKSSSTPESKVINSINK